VTAAPTAAGAVLAAAEAARARIAPHLYRTPLERSAPAEQAGAAAVWLKHEQQQVTGSFKPRGSLTKLTRLSAAERARGVVAPTAGNHGIGLAWAAQRLGTPAHIFLPEGTDPAKLARLDRLGASVTAFVDIEAARLAALSAAEAHGWTFSSAYADPDMVVGAATLGLELAEELSDVEVVLVPIGGGGLAAGIACALAQRRPEVPVWAVATAASPTWPRWHAAGRPVPVELSASVAEGLSGTVEPTTPTFEPVLRLVPRVLAVTDEQIVDAMRWLAAAHQQIVEPSGAAALAAVLDPGSGLAGARVAAVLTGRNVGLPRYLDLLGGPPAG
jgi:threonine dehydratase